MTHEHGSEYQVRIVHDDETEKLSGWMNGQEEVSKAITGLRQSSAKAYWLQARNIRCPDCPQKESQIVEVRLTLTTSETIRFTGQRVGRPYVSIRTSSAGM